MVASDPITVDTVLAPVDGSDESATASEYAVAVADRYDASIHTLYILGRGVVRGMDAGTVDESDIAESTQGFLEDIAQLADESDMQFSSSVTHGFSQTQKTRHPGSAVLDAADAIGADFIVLPRESVTDSDADILERAAEYVLAYASQPVLSV